MLDWKNLTTDPNDKETQLAISAFLKSICSFYPQKRHIFLSEYFSGCRVLDIGAGEHDPSYYNETWEHAVLEKSASYILGIDINPSLCEHYKKKGFNFKCADASSDVDLGERFDKVFIGDVIEHVNNPVALLEFAKRHLSGKGAILVTTPNPFFILIFFARLRQKGWGFFENNMEHTCWVTPFNANELARRSGLFLTKIYFPTIRFRDCRSLKQVIRATIQKIPITLRVFDLAYNEYIFEFSNEKPSPDKIGETSSKE